MISFFFYSKVIPYSKVISQWKQYLSNLLFLKEMITRKEKGRL